MCVPWVLLVSKGGETCDAMRLGVKGIDEWDGGLTTEVTGLGMGHVQCIQSRHYAALRKPGKGTKNRKGREKMILKTWIVHISPDRRPQQDGGRRMRVEYPLSLPGPGSVLALRVCPLSGPACLCPWLYRL